jgi:transcriptional regulator with XRE-family HTH domain
MYPAGNILGEGRLQTVKAPERVHFHTILTFWPEYSRAGTGWPDVDPSDESSVEHRARATTSAFGSLIRRRRKDLKIRQAQLALATGVGRRFLIELEAGKPSCQLGRSLLVAEALGLGPADILASDKPFHPVAPELPDLIEGDLIEEEQQEPNG